MDRGSMSNDEINRYIATEIMGLCWHNPMIVVQQADGHRVWECRKCRLSCGESPTYEEVVVFSNPDYCSDDSPRRLMHEVEETVIELLRETVKNPRVIYCRYLMRANGFRYEDLGFLYEQVIRSTAEQRAKACVEAHKALKTDSVVNT